MIHRTRSVVRWFVPALICALFITGCAIRIGTPFKTEQVPQLQVGKTTQSQVVEYFGEPESKGLKDGRPLWTYLFARLSLGGTATGTILSIEFNEQGVVSSYSYVPY
ncbi:MAG TPA: outer membrane protein assembly factor BamE [Nitrospiria bacterium]|nr:outer membrane protein assembly factor BamE [Nitrospiria bacterium]